MIIKTTATRFNQQANETSGIDKNFSIDSDLTLERNQAVESGSSTTNLPHKNAARTGSVSVTNVCQDVVEVITEAKNAKETPKKNPTKPSTLLPPETNMVKSTSANTVSMVTRKYSPFSLKPSASSPGFSYFSSNRDSEKDKKVKNNF